MKYTIIYSETFHIGSHTCSVTKYARVDTDDLPALLNEDKYKGGLWFVFEGWPKLEGEKTSS